MPQDLRRLESLRKAPKGARLGGLTEPKGQGDLGLTDPSPGDLVQQAREL